MQLENENAKPTIRRIIVAFVLVGLIQLVIELFGLWYWEKHGYFPLADDVENLVPYLVQSPAVWWIICSVLYGRLFLRGRYLAILLVAVQIFIFLLAFSTPNASMWVGPTILIMISVLINGRKSSTEKVSRDDILDDI